MKQETFKNLDLEKQVELYNEWLTEIKMTEYYLLDWLEGQRLGDYDVI